MFGRLMMPAKVADDTRRMKTAKGKKKRQPLNPDALAENKFTNEDILEDLKKHRPGTFKVHIGSVTRKCGIPRRGVC